MIKPISSIKVAIVEDDEACRTNLQALLNQTPDFECRQTFASGASALKQLSQNSPDIVIVDLDLPGMSGEELIRAFRINRIRSRPVVLTISNEPARIGAALEAGAFGYLLKDIPAPELVARLREAHAGGAPLSPAISLMVVQILHRRGAIESQISPHLFKILQLLAHGRLICEIATELGLAQGTIRSDLSRIYDALHVNTASQAVAVYYGAQSR